MIDLEGVTHTFRPRWPLAPAAPALDGLSLSVPAGQLLGVVGLNGAGKTTLLRILLGYLNPRVGTVTIEGLPARRYAEKHGIGYVPEQPAIPRGWTVEGALRAYGMMGDADEDLGDRVEALIARFDLQEQRDHPVGKLSKGSAQRVALAQALLGDRRLLVLDEPTDGLDPLRVTQFRSILAHWRSEHPARVAIIATHDLDMLERIADRVVMLHRGRIVADLPRDALTPGSLEPTFLERIGAGVGR